MKVGFWLDWNSNIEDEISMHRDYLAYVVFDRDITPVRIEKPADVARFDGDLLTFDYGGITGGYGPNKIVPVLLRAVVKWCEKNPDRLALIWCTFPPKVYLDDFKRFGGVPSNLRCIYRRESKPVEAELRAHYLA